MLLAKSVMHTFHMSVKESLMEVRNHPMPDQPLKYI